MQFQNGTSTYTFNLVGGSLSINAAGLVGQSANATFNTSVTNLGNGGTIDFRNSSTAANATIVNNNGGQTYFFNTSTAANATIVNNSGGTTTFGYFGGDAPSAGNATIINNSGSGTYFNLASSAGQARIITNAGGAFDITGLSSTGTTVGSIEGAGSYAIGPKQLIVGSNNLSTEVSGTINEGGSFPNTGGSLVKVGTGTLTLSGTNTYRGGTTVTSGSLTIGNNNALGSGTLAMAAGTTLSFLNTANFTISNPITISGDPSFTLPSGTTQTITGVISDGSVPGTIDMSGAGALVLSATNTYTGATNVNSGTLQVDGSIASSSLTSVNTGGTLTGVGTVGNTQINSGGIFAPGAAGVPGSSMTIAGNLAFQSGAIYLVQINPTTASFANVTGTASLAGNVLAAFAPGSYLTKQYTILHSTGLNGAFAALGTTNLPAGFDASLSYTGTDVVLNLSAVLGQQLPAGGLTGNEQNVATSLNNFFNDGGTLTPNFLTIFGLSGGNLSTALSQLSGEASTDAERGGFQVMTQFLGLMLDPFLDGRTSGMAGGANAFAPEQEASLPPDIALAYAGALKAPSKPATLDQRWAAWGSAFGGSNQTDGDAAAGTNNVTARTFGFAGGMDYHFTPDTVAGFALAGGGTNWGLSQGLGGGRSDAFQVGVYGKTNYGPAYTAAALAFTNNWMTTDRYAPLGDQLTAKFNAQSYGGRIETGYRCAVLPMIGVTAYAALQAQSFHTPSYSETDLTGGGFGLSYNAMSASDTRSELGARFDDLTMLGAMPLMLRARAAWAHDWVSNPSLGAVFQTLPGASFTVNGAAPPKNSALASAGAELHLTNNWSLAAKFDGEFASGSQTYAGTGTLRYVW